MKNDDDIRAKWRSPLIVSFVILLVFSGILGYWVLDFNHKTVELTGTAKQSEVYLDMDIGNPKGELWESTLQVSDHPYSSQTFVGETINCSLVNENNYNIKNWTFKINPQTECYLNGFWGGSVEVHQFRDGEEIVETIPEIVAASEIKNLIINPYINAMMVQLLPGDYFIYIPKFDAGSDIVQAHEAMGIVFNFYYIDSLDFSDYRISYQNNIKMNQLWEYKAIVILWILWLLGFLFYLSVVLVHRRVLRETRNSDQNISVMADLYLETYRIVPEKQLAYLIKRKNTKSVLALEDKPLQDGLDQYINDECNSFYSSDLKAFLDFSTLEERMENDSSIVMEYKSKSIGWCSLRLFKLTGNKDERQYVLALQDINEEKHKLQKFEEHIRQAENAALLQGNFMDTVFNAMNGMVAGIRLELKTLEEAFPDDQLKVLTNNVSNNVEHLLLLGNFVYDLFAIEADRFQINPETYNIQDMVHALNGMLKPYLENSNISFELAIDNLIPARLIGDRKRLMQILIVILSSSMLMTKEGAVKLSVFGKQTGNTEELLFSIKDNTIGFTEEQLAEIQGLLKSSDMKPVGNAAYVYFQVMNQILRKMNSELKIVSVLGSGSEFYFAIEQEVINE